MIFCAHGTMAARDAVLFLDAAADPSVLPGASAAWGQSGGRGARAEVSMPAAPATSDRVACIASHGLGDKTV